MNYKELREALQIQISQVVIATNTLTQTVRDLLERCYANGPIVISDARPEPGDDVHETVVIAGKSNFLNVADLVVQEATFFLDDQGNVQATLKYSLLGEMPGPTAWKFSRSFPDLPTVFNVQSNTYRSPLDELTLFNAYFIVTTYPHREPDFGVDLEPGINFLSKMRPTGALGVFESSLHGVEALTLYGTVSIPLLTDVTPPLTFRQYPWDVNPAVPGINLKADLGVDIHLGSMVFNQALFRVYSPLATHWLEQNPTFEPVVGYTGTITIPSAGVSGKMTASMLLGLDTVLLSGFFQGITVKNFASMLDIAGPGDLVGSLPQQIKTQIETLEDRLGALELMYAAVAVSLNGSDMTIDGTDFSIGLPLQWHVWDDLFIIDNIACHFFINSPFSSPSLSVILMGTCEIAGVPVIVVAGDLGGFTVYARLAEEQTIPLKHLMETYVPDVPPPGDLTINALGVTISPQNYYAMQAVIAEQPHPWVIDVGFQQLTISDVVLVFTYPKGGPVSGSFGGTIAFSDVAKLSARYDIPGNFVVRGTFPLIKFTEILGKLCNQTLVLPGAFDLTFEESSVLIQKVGENYVFQFATQLENVGTFALEARRVSTGQNQWGFAAGLDLSLGKASSLPALEPLRLFEEFFSLQKFFLLISSFADPNFSFPDLANFNSPRISAKGLSLPAQAGGLVAGFNLYAQWQIKTDDKQQQLLQKFLGLDPTIGVTLQVGKNPTQDVRLYVSYTTEIQHLPLTCQFGGQLQGSDIGLFLIGSMKVSIQEQLQQFDVVLLFVENGAFISTTVKGSTPIDFKVFKLGNLAIEIGIDWEGIPSLGIAGSIAAGFESSVAVFFDSADPAKSMVAGSLSDLSLRDVIDTLAGTTIPSEIDAVLDLVSVKGTHQFTIPGDLANDLDNLRLDKVAAVFESAGKVHIPSSSSQVFLVVDTRGARWYLTDLMTMLHYQLVKHDQDIQVSIEAQFQCVLEAMSIGSIPWNQPRTYINGSISFFGFNALATIDINTNQGIAIDGGMDRIVIGTESLFAIEKAQGAGGPQISAATFPQPAQADEQFRSPHFYINGTMHMLGLSRALYIRLTKGGFEFDLSGSLLPAVNFDVHGRFFGPTDLEVGGGIKVGIDTIDLGPLGKINLKSDASCTMDIKVHGTQITATLDASFEFASQNYPIPKYELDVNAEPLKDLPATLRDKIKDLLSNELKDAQKWADYVAKGYIEGVQDMEKVLQDVYHQAPAKAKEIADTARKAAQEVATTCAMTTAALHL